MKQSQLDRRAYILDRASKMKLVKEVYSTKWTEYEKVWKMFEKNLSGEDEWMADLPDTLTFATIKTAQSAFVDSKVIPTVVRHEDDPQAKATDIKDLYIDVSDKGNLDLELYFARLDAFKLGNGFTKTIYVKENREVWDIKSFDPDTNEFKWKKKTVNEFDDPKTIRVSPYLILKDDLARADWTTCRDLIELEVMGRDAAQAKYGHLLNFDEVPKTTSLLTDLTQAQGTDVADTSTGSGLIGTEFEGLAKYTFFSPGFDWSDEVVEIIHYWNKGIKTPSGCLDSYEILINGAPAQIDEPKKPSPIPYVHKQLPYTHYMYSPYSGDEAYAAGIIEIGKSEAKAIRSWRERMDNRQGLSMFSPAFSDVNDEIDQKVLKLKPLTVIRTKGGVPKYAQIPGLTNADFAVLDRHEAAYKRAVGIDERTLGVESSGPRLTATEVSFLREAAMKRLKEFAFLYKNALLHTEIRLKLSLFKQYYASPFMKEGKVKNDTTTRIMKGKFKEFKVKTGNVYTKKQLSPNYFEGDVDVELDLQVLMPVTQSELITMWSQILRDAIPFVQAGAIDLSLSKVFEKYVEALGTSMNALRDDKTAMAIEMAETEHKLYADKNTSPGMKEVLPKGTLPPYLTEDHLKKHNELIDSDLEIEDAEKLRLIAHIKQDLDNLQKLKAQQASPNLASLTPQATGTIGGLPGSSQQMPSPMMPKTGGVAYQPVPMPQQ